MRGMRRANREVTDEAGKRAIVEACKVVHVGTQDEEGMFVVPLNFGFEWIAEDSVPATPHLVLWLHSAREGRKADAFRANPQVAIEMDADCHVISGDYSCTYSLAYQSIMGTGRIALVEDAAEKRHGLSLVMEHMAPGAPVEFADAAVERVAVWRIDVEHFTAKQRV